MLDGVRRQRTLAMWNMINLADSKLCGTWPNDQPELAPSAAVKLQCYLWIHRLGGLRHQLQTRSQRW